MKTRVPGHAFALYHLRRNSLFSSFLAVFAWKVNIFTKILLASLLTFVNGQFFYNFRFLYGSSKI